jgi:uncharacterized protein (UPF0276 family)
MLAAQLAILNKLLTMMPQTTVASLRLSSSVIPSPGFGLGLRTVHYNDLLNNDTSHEYSKEIDWLEIISDNFLVQGGKPLYMLEQFRQRYPLAMHGVGMSLGSVNGINIDYINTIKQLANTIQPLWVSDHLCWTGATGRVLHDLYPLPYTDEAAKIIICNIKKAQDILQRRLVIENVSSYITYQSSANSEWHFLSYILEQADCHLLLDINNVYVSSQNHQFNPLDYIRGIPANRVQQIHLAGHSNHGSHIIDTHDQPVCQSVWDLYGKTCQIIGHAATMIERDDNIPPLSELIAELNIAKELASKNIKPESIKLSNATINMAASTTSSQTLPHIQNSFVCYILNDDKENILEIANYIHNQKDVDIKERLNIYHHAYRARLIEVLAECFAKTYLYMGSDTFSSDVTQYIVCYPPKKTSLNSYGIDLPQYFKQLYPDNPELYELAQLDWDLRACFDMADTPALTSQIVQSDITQAWLTQIPIIHPNAVCRTITVNVVQLWKAIDDDIDVPPVHNLLIPHILVVWRKGLKPHFKTFTHEHSIYINALFEWNSIVQACDILTKTGFLLEPEVLGAWLNECLEDGLFINNI